MPRFKLRLPNPHERRKSFRIYRDGHPLIDPRMEAINDKYSAGQLDLESAKREAYKVKQDLERRERPDKPTYPDQNLDVLSKAISDYRERTKIREKSRRVAISGMRRCIDLLGDKILYSISLEELQRLVDRQSQRAQPKLAVYFNVLLNHTGRKDRLRIPAHPDHEVKYLTMDEMRVVLPYVKEDYRATIVVAFTTGCRLGEVFGLHRFGRKASVWVERQMYEKADERGNLFGPCKWKKKRWAPVMEWGRTIVTEWIARIEQMDEGDRLALRRAPWNEIVANACREAFPKRANKHLNFRDIRHCYAIHWLDKGATLRHVSQSMGNTERVVAKHYSGFVQTDEAEESMLALERK